MSARDGGPAFPGIERVYTGDHNVYVELPRTGMTLRDYFAAKALAGMDLKDDGDYSDQDRRAGDPKLEAKWAAVAAYRYADAMLAARGES